MITPISSAPKEKPSKNCFNFYEFLTKIPESPNFIIFTADTQIAKETRQKGIEVFEATEYKKLIKFIKETYL